MNAPPLGFGIPTTYLLFHARVYLYRGRFPQHKASSISDSQLVSIDACEFRFSLSLTHLSSSYEFEAALTIK